MENFCGIISKLKDESFTASNSCLTFRELENLTTLFTDEIPIMADIFERQTCKVLENNKKISDNRTFVLTSSTAVLALQNKILEIEKDSEAISFDLDVLEFFIQTLESQAPELQPCNADIQRFPLYQTLLDVICNVDNSKDSMERYHEEYRAFVQWYRQKNVITCLLDLHVKILQNIKAHLDDLEHVNASVESKLEVIIKEFCC